MTNVKNIQLTRRFAPRLANARCRYEITEILPDRMVSQAMDKQAAAERHRREKVLEAEGLKVRRR